MDMAGSMQISTLGAAGHIGIGGNTIPPAGPGEVVAETMEVPDHCVGLGNFDKDLGIQFFALSKVYVVYLFDGIFQ